MIDTEINIKFFGAAGTVTGSRHLLTLGKHKIFIDCGLFQGGDVEKLNDIKLPFDVSEIDCVLLTHGHLDHCGYLPVFVRNGFKGKVYGTAPTLEIAKIILHDCADIAEENKRILKQRRHRTKEEKNALQPKSWHYYSKEVEATTRLFQSIEAGEWFNLFDDVEVRFSYNGHIIGATFIEIRFNGKTIVFSGDIGRQNDLLLHKPCKPKNADILVIESTYGNRLHETDPQTQLLNFISEAFAKKGTIIIPCFAVERNQQLMYLLWQLKKSGRIHTLPIYMDSPMAVEVLEVFRDFPQWHKLTAKDISEMCESIKLVDGIEETYRVIDNKSPKIIVAGSGMITGGRVLTYLKYYIEDPNTTILLTGFQAKNTPGRLLQDGAADIEIEDKIFCVNASVKTIRGLSGHADKSELIGWMNELENKPEKTYIMHGEPEASEALRAAIENTYMVHAKNALSSL